MLDQPKEGASSGSSSASIELKFPAGFVYDPGKSRLYYAGSRNALVDVSQIIYIQLIISGVEMDTMFIDIPLDTLHTAVPVTYGERRFVVTVQMNNGDTLTGSKTVQVSPSGPSAIELEVELNDLPIINSVDLSPISVAVNEFVTATVSAFDPDGGALEYKWEADGGTLAGDGPVATWVSDVDGFFNICVTVIDSGGGTAFWCAPVNVGGDFIDPGAGVGGGLVIKEIEVSNYSPAVGDTVELHCEAEFIEDAGAVALTDDITYSWYGPEGVIADSNETIYNVTSAAETILDCYATSGSEVAVASVTLNSSGNSPPDVSASASNITPVNGETVTFNCFVSDPNGDFFTQWWEDPAGAVFNTPDLDYLVVDSTIPETFTCYADDQNGGVSSHSVTINVGGGGGGEVTAPFITSVDTSNFGPVDGEIVNLSCYFDAQDPAAIDVTWYGSDSYSDFGQYVSYTALGYDVFITCRVTDRNTGAFDEVTINLIAGSGGGGGGGANNPPIVNSFWSSDYYPDEGDMISYQCDLFDPDYDLVLQEVTTTDGAVLPPSGNYYVPYGWDVITFTCRGQDSFGIEAYSSFDILPQALNYPPSVYYVDAFPVNPFAIGDKVDHTCSATDPEGDPLTYDWDINGSYYASGPDFSKIWDGAPYTATCTVTDTHGNKASGDVYVTP